ncbi:magnesium transporter [Neomegalonema sp.]|uniref:magnesium transporter n=1 Tax=Neomegalonema sp. TaxID=2039713 RepID=UPI0026262AD3|nr:magnesium transporter [Neomegalonema sp.]MDD2869540.1 magnesium transporter [Neomegalonema sp.]
MASDSQEPQRDLREEEDAESHGLTEGTVEAVIEALAADDDAAVGEILGEERPEDVADLLEQLKPDDRRRAIRALEPELAGPVLTEMDEGARDDALEAMEPEAIARAVGELESDDAVYLLEDLDEERQQEILKSLDAGDRLAIEQSLVYPEDSAGRMMQKALVAAPLWWTVGALLDYLRRAKDVPEDFYAVVVVDPAHKPVGLAPLGRLVTHMREERLQDVMQTEFHSFKTSDSARDVAYAFNKYHLVTAPVTDEAGRLVGAIMIDDAVETLEDEAEEDLLRLGGVGDEEISDSTRETLRQRLPWLGVNLPTAFLAAAVIALFEDTIGKLTVLAALMPIVASMGGNAATQTLTVTVRALAAKELTRTNARRIIRRELLVGICNGLIFAVLVGTVAALWQSSPKLGLVIAAAMMANFLTAAMAGILIPMLLDKLKVDPAVASGVFVTTLTDVVGFFAFLGLATAFLL